MKFLKPNINVLAPKEAPLVVHINKHIIRANEKDGSNEPPVTVRRGRGKAIHRCHHVEFHGASRLIYNPENPLPCGARMWSETHSSILCTVGSIEQATEEWEGR